MDGNALIALVKSFLDPATTAGLVLIPSIFTVYMIVEGLKYFFYSEQEKEQHPYMKTLTRGLLVAVILFSLTAILKIFGINV